MPTDVLGIKNDFSSEVIPDSYLNTVADDLEEVTIRAAELFQQNGFFRDTDANGTIVAGELSVDISAVTGAVIGDSSGERRIFGAAAERYTGLPASQATVYVWALRDGGYTHNTSGTPPAHSHLAMTLATDADDVTAIVNNPTGRTNLGVVLSSLQPLKGSTAPLQFGRLSKSVAGAVDVTLAANEYVYPWLVLTGAITANINVILPHGDSAFWMVENATSGAFTLTAKGATGTGVLIPQGTRCLIYSDGTNFHRLAPSVMDDASLSAYTPTNVSTDRSFDANATTLDEVADVLGTLIADLQKARVIK